MSTACCRPYDELIDPVPVGLRWLDAQSGNTVRWCVDFTDSPPGFTQEDMEECFRYAFWLWNRNTSLVTEEVALGQPCEIEIRFEFIDGPGNFLAQTFVPVGGVSMGACGLPCGDIEHDTADQPITLTDFCNVTIHEVGHALGLFHPNDLVPPEPIGGNIMDPTYLFGTPLFTQLSPLDAVEIKKRYP